MQNRRNCTLVKLLANWMAIGIAGSGPNGQSMLQVAFENSAMAESVDDALHPITVLSSNSLIFSQQGFACVPPLHNSSGPSILVRSQLFFF